MRIALMRKRSQRTIAEAATVEVVLEVVATAEVLQQTSQDERLHAEATIGLEVIVQEAAVTIAQEAALTNAPPAEVAAPPPSQAGAKSQMPMTVVRHQPSVRN